MDIKNINNGQFFDPNYSADKVNRQEISTNPADNKVNSADTSKVAQGDKVTLSDNGIKTDKAFALNVLDKLNTDSAEKLNSIKAKIADGTYNSDEVIAKISNAIADEIASIPSPEAKGLSEEQKDFLLNDPEVQQTVANKISQELKNL